MLPMFTKRDQELIEQVAERLRRCRSVFFITGAGLSADSGLPTYRGVGGLYNQDTTEEGLPIEQIVSGQTMAENPKLAWKYISRIEHTCRDASYNRGHEVIAEMEKHFEKVCVLTQNIDGFHQAAGATNVIDIHGDYHDLLCSSPHCWYCTRVPDYSHLDIPPYCPRCHDIIRPAVVLFGEVLLKDRMEKLMQELHRDYDIVFSVGTTSIFPYISEPVRQAHRRQIPTVEINPDLTEISDIVDYKIEATAAATLDALWKRCQVALKPPDSE